MIVIAATNKPEMIDPAFLRPGRFDKIFYVALPDRSARIDILKLQLRSRTHQLRADEITEIAERLEGYSGADIEHIIEEAAFSAFDKRAPDLKTCITKNEMEGAIKATPKSVSPDEVRKFVKWAKERGIRI